MSRVCVLYSGFFLIASPVDVFESTWTHTSDSTDFPFFFYLFQRLNFLFVYLFGLSLFLLLRVARPVVRTFFALCVFYCFPHICQQQQHNKTPIQVRTHSSSIIANCPFLYCFLAEKGGKDKIVFFSFLKNKTQKCLITFKVVTNSNFVQRGKKKNNNLKKKSWCTHSRCARGLGLNICWGPFYYLLFFSRKDGRS